ncbi:MAG: prephenate dehydratase [Pseudomonadota bacterium]
MVLPTPKLTGAIAFQGALGAYSHIACMEAVPDWNPLPCASFEDAFEAVEREDADLAMIPIENSQAGRVADIHLLLPQSDLHIVGEHFHRVRHCVLGLPDAKIEDVEFARSHPQALAQCRARLRGLKIAPLAHSDTANAAKQVVADGDPKVAAIASKLAGEVYGLKTLIEHAEDIDHNTTRFVILAREPITPNPVDGAIMTTLVFQVRNVPAALFKALGGFATNGVNMTKLESYQRGGSFSASEFFTDIEGHPSDRNVALAMEELNFHTRWVRILGSYTQQRGRGV